MTMPSFGRGDEQLVIASVEQTRDCTGHDVFISFTCELYYFILRGNTKPDKNYSLL